jgi:hypothetical protein
MNLEDLERCPYDLADLEASMWSGGSLLLVCPACGREWEAHGAWVRSVSEPADVTRP